MTLKLVNGDYAKDGETGEPLEVDYTEELLQNAFIALNARRGRFYPNKSFGSRIKEITAEPSEEYAFAYAVQALDGLDGVYVKSAKICGSEAIIGLLLCGREEEVRVNLENII